MPGIIYRSVHSLADQPIIVFYEVTCGLRDEVAAILHAVWRRKAGSELTGSVKQSLPLEHVGRAKERRKPGQGQRLLSLITASRSRVGGGWCPYGRVSDLRDVDPSGVTARAINSETHYRVAFNLGSISMVHSPRNAFKPLPSEERWNVKKKTLALVRERNILTTTCRRS
jgi:hypothetical protein